MKFSGFKYLIGQGVDNVWKNRMMALSSQSTQHPLNNVTMTNTITQRAVHSISR